MNSPAISAKNLPWLLQHNHPAAAEYFDLVFLTNSQLNEIYWDVQNDIEKFTSIISQLPPCKENKKSIKKAKKMLNQDYRMKDFIELRLGELKHLNKSKDPEKACLLP